MYVGDIKNKEENRRKAAYKSARLGTEFVVGRSVCEAPTPDASSMDYAVVSAAGSAISAVGASGSSGASGNGGMPA